MVRCFLSILRILLANSLGALEAAD